MVTLTVNKILLSPGVQTPPTVDLFIAEFYGGAFTSFATGVVIDASGNIVGSLPSVLIDPTLRYTLRSVNNMCAYQYDQDLSINISCPIGYTLNGAKTECYQDVRVAPTLPNNSSSAASRTQSSFTICGSYIFDSGYASDGTGATTHISSANAFWKNVNADCLTPGNTTNGPFNRCGVWNPIIDSDQIIGYSVCQSDTVERTFYIGIGTEYGATLRLNGTDIFVQDLVQLDDQFGIDGSCYKAWMIYPLMLPANQLNIIEVVSENDLKTSLGMEVYDNTAAEITAATSYGALNLIFSTKDMVGLPLQIGNHGYGYTCPSGYAFESCASPVACYRRLEVSPIYS